MRTRFSLGREWNGTHTNVVNGFQNDHRGNVIYLHYARHDKGKAKKHVFALQLIERASRPTFLLRVVTLCHGVSKCSWAISSL